MAVNKVVVNNETLIDLTTDTVSASTLASGTTAHDASGAPIVGILDTSFFTNTDIITFEGNGEKMFENIDVYNVFLKPPSKKLAFKNIYNAENMFASAISDYSLIDSFSVQQFDADTPISFKCMFYDYMRSADDDYYFTSMPPCRIEQPNEQIKISDYSFMFADLPVEHINTDYFPNNAIWAWTYKRPREVYGTVSCAYMFYQSDIHEIDLSFLPKLTGSNSFLNMEGMFQHCFALTSITNVPVQRYSNYIFSSTSSTTYQDLYKDAFNYLPNLQHLTFETINGTGEMYKQVIDLTQIPNISQADTPVAYFFDSADYNHDSVIETIASLPSTNGTATLKLLPFLRYIDDSTSQTYYLTEEEAAVATAKGWTIVYK